jgi:hypothetical protein
MDDTIALRKDYQIVTQGLQGSIKMLGIQIRLCFVICPIGRLHNDFRQGLQIVSHIGIGSK